ncbi:MAG: hypothetical protein BAA01_03985 [Bacillus thermozeamaize]|uniref:Uncharacterized protein n=1 Tax=Bacillus thermozeamaize TaxID=230954 RepID=A0A1Y3PHE4_9BACI|nr:MAG: hypothetical protein BAA01_03985 [Bacillus thermozeamaize]
MRCSRPATAEQQRLGGSPDADDEAAAVAVVETLLLSWVTGLALGHGRGRGASARNGPGGHEGA